MLQRIKKIVPPMLESMHKGQAGKVGVIGGSKRYTGAPYFAAMTALQVGADLCTVFCTDGAAGPIKSYSPELMVHPVMHESGRDLSDLKELRPDLNSKHKRLDQITSHLAKETPEQATSRSKQEVIDSVVEAVKEWLPKLTVLVIGPGLSRDELMLRSTVGIIEAAKQLHMPIVLDADSLFIVSALPDLLRGYTRAVLTPNKAEFRRLWDAVAEQPWTDQDKQAQDQIKHLPADVSVPVPVDSPLCSQAAAVARKLGGVTVFQKGQVDVATDGTTAVVCNAKGSPRRCGGQGDLTAGATGIFLHWTFNGDRKKGQDGQQPEPDQKKPKPDEEIPGSLLACWAASRVVRDSAERAFANHFRATTTTLIMQELGPVMQHLFPYSKP